MAVFTPTFLVSARISDVIGTGDTAVMPSGSPGEILSSKLNQSLRPQIKEAKKDVFWTSRRCILVW